MDVINVSYEWLDEDEDDPVSQDLAPVMASTPEKQQTRVLCDDCGKTYSSRKALNMHARKHHGKGKAAPFKCIFCSKDFFSKIHYDAHINSHSKLKPHKCDKCKSAYSSKISINAHVCVSKEKEFMCQTCRKLFASKRYLKEHNKVHSSATLYSCNTCNKSYKYRSSLRHHEKTRYLWLKWWAKLSILLFVFSIYWCFVLVVGPLIS